MRGDMPKVIVERARLGGGTLRRGRRERDDDLAVSKIGMKRHARMRGGYKTLNENLNPLKRYLATQVGRPWNKVWSEICENLKTDNTVQQHVRDHIPDFVAIKTSLRDGEVWVHDRFRFAVTPLKESFAKLFVDPKSGLLRRNKHWRGRRGGKQAQRIQQAKERDARMRAVSPAKQLHLLDDGGWWEVTLAAVPTGIQEAKTRYGSQKQVYELGVDDAVLRAGLSKLGREKLYGRPGVYAASKRQLSKKEIRALKLRP